MDLVERYGRGLVISSAIHIAGVVALLGFGWWAPSLGSSFLAMALWILLFHGWAFWSSLRRTRIEVAPDDFRTQARQHSVRRPWKSDEGAGDGSKLPQVLGLGVLPFQWGAIEKMKEMVSSPEGSAINLPPIEFPAAATPPPDPGVWGINLLLGEPGILAAGIPVLFVLLMWTFMPQADPVVLAPADE